MKILDCIWPHLKGPEVEDSERNPKNQIQLKDFGKKNKEKVAMELALVMYNEQRERINSIQSKSIVLVGFFGSVVVLSSFLLKDILSPKNSTDIFEYWVLLFNSIVILYASQVVLNSLKALVRQSYSLLDEKRFINRSYNEITQHIIDCVKKNYNVINKKVNYMTLAQKFAKRVTYLFIIFSIIIILLSLLYLLKMYLCCH